MLGELESLEEKHGPEQTTACQEIVPQGRIRQDPRKGVHMHCREEYTGFQRRSRAFAGLNYTIICTLFLFISSLIHSFVCSFSSYLLPPTLFFPKLLGSSDAFVMAMPSFRGHACRQLGRIQVYHRRSLGLRRTAKIRGKPSEFREEDALSVWHISGVPTQNHKGTTSLAWER